MGQSQSLENISLRSGGRGQMWEPARISVLTKSAADTNSGEFEPSAGLVSDFATHPPTAGRGVFPIAVWFHRTLQPAESSTRYIGRAQPSSSLHFGIILTELSVNDAAAISSRKLAWQCAEFLWGQDDAALRSLGLELLSIKPGHAVVAMTVLPEMVSGIGITHGAVIFTFADATFSLAASSYNERTVAAHCCISFLQPTRLGDRLVATATEVVRSARSGIYDISVTLESAIVAEFRAHSRVIGGALLPAPTAAQNCAAAEPVNK
jgi:acyl-CoA thioesterase